MIHDDRKGIGLEQFDFGCSIGASLLIISM
jgi:hypothetical protein